MKALFVADLDCESASGHQRLWALRKISTSVKVFNKQGISSRRERWNGRLAKLFRQPNFLNRYRKLGCALTSACVEFQPDIVWIEWPREFAPSTIENLRNLLPETTFVSFQDDNPWGHRLTDQWIWKNYFRVAPFFDLHLVKRSRDAVELKKLGASNCREWIHGIYSPIFYPSETMVQPKYSVSFVGTCMDERSRLVEKILEAGIPLHVFGTNWKKRTKLPSRFPNNFHDSVKGFEYAEVIRSSQICLGLVSHSNCDEWTMRSFEVPGCGKTLLAERTESMENWFDAGKEMEFFSSVDECIEKIRKMLETPTHCIQLGVAAYQKCIDQRWTLESRMQELFENSLYPVLKC